VARNPCRARPPQECVELRRSLLVQEAHVVQPRQLFRLSAGVAREAELRLVVRAEAPGGGHVRVLEARISVQRARRGQDLPDVARKLSERRENALSRDTGQTFRVGRDVVRCGFDDDAQKRAPPLPAQTLPVP